jgi:ATP-dependent RNA helicase DeaD
MNFEEIGVSTKIAESLRKHGIESPMPVQAKAVPLVMKGKDVIVRSKTGSGKTIAFLIPILERLDVNDRKRVQALVLEPTRELAVQVGRELVKLDPTVRHLVVYGGVSIETQMKYLHEGCSVVVGTPGRILDHISRKTLDLSHVKFVVLDEADRMLDMGFIDDVRDILKHTPSSRQTMLFSATVPEEILRLSKNYMHTPEKLMLEVEEIVVKKIRQEFYGCAPRQKLDAVIKYLHMHRAKISKTLVFCNTKRWADSLSRILHGKGFSSRAIHSDMSQNFRERVMDDFKAGKFMILVATDVAARGLHIPDVSHVINYDLPKNGKDYIHRVGRTGRAGAEGHAASFLVTEDTPFLRDIERETGQYIEVKDITSMIVPSRRETEHP